MTYAYMLIYIYIFDRYILYIYRQHNPIFFLAYIPALSVLEPLRYLLDTSTYFCVAYREHLRLIAVQWLHLQLIGPIVQTCHSETLHTEWWQLSLFHQHCNTNVKAAVNDGNCLFLFLYFISITYDLQHGNCIKPKV